MKPKSADVIRVKLVRVRELAEREKDLGPHAAGLTATDRFPVATFVDPACAYAYQQRLLDAGIHSEHHRLRDRMAVLVDVEDRVVAVQVLDAHLQAFPDRRRRRTFGYEATTALTLVGLLSIIVTLVVVGNVDEQNRLTMQSFKASMSATGLITLHLMCFGLLIDLMRSHQLNLERGSFSLKAVLWLMLAAGLVVYWAS